MKLTRSKKIILTIILAAFVVLLFNSNTVFAAINDKYPGIDGVNTTTMDSAVSGSSLLGLLARLVYAVGQLIEWLTGLIFKLLTGIVDFPWADKIVFNSVPLLDVNFINPAEGSFLAGNMTDLVKNIYSTIMTLSVAFFGITVLITSIRLVITTIASEKAKYKQAIVNWLVGFVTLFCIHYAMGFIFYLNEELVKVASQLVNTQLEEYSDKVVASVKYNEQIDDIIDNMGETVYKGSSTKYNGKKIKDILSANKHIVQTWLTFETDESSKGLHEMFMKNNDGLWDKKTTTNDQRQAFAEIIVWSLESTTSIEELRKIKSRVFPYEYDNLGPNNQVGQGLDINDFYDLFAPFDVEIKDRMKKNDDDVGWYYNPKKNENLVTAYKEWKKGYKWFYASAGIDVLYDDSWTNVEIGVPYYWTQVIDELIALKTSAQSGSVNYYGGGAAKRLIPDLAAYFKQNAHETVVSDETITALTNTGNVRIQNMIMYAILVVQSLILLIAYIKRLFYVLMLGLMAPVVVVFDFFQKFGK